MAADAGSRTHRYGFGDRGHDRVAEEVSMKLLVTGGAGFIGSHYVRSLLTGAWGGTEPDRVVVLDKLTYAGNLENLAPVVEDDRLRIVEGDILDRPTVDRLMADADAVMHLAAESHVDRSIIGAPEFVMTNVVGTQVLLESAVAHGMKRFVHVSTDEVYGSIEEGSWDEEQPLQPNSPYSASKASSDLLVRAYHHTHGLPVVTTNCSNNYGPYQFPEKLIPVIIQSIMARKPIPVYGDGMNVRDWLYVRDHAEALWQVLTRGKEGETYNVGGHNEWANIRIVELICDLMDEFAPQLGGQS